jgi:hypothetical protein
VSEPLSLQRVHYFVKYVPPPPPEPGKKRLPEEIEAEIKLQEQELEKIAQVHIRLIFKYIFNTCPTLTFLVCLIVCSGLSRQSWSVGTKRITSGAQKICMI